MADYARVLRRSLCAAMACAATTVAGRAVADTPNSQAFREHVAHAAPTDPFGPNDKLNYFGGRVISNVKVVAVTWGTNVDANYMSKLAGFYQMITVSPWIDWLSEYDTVGKIGYIDGKVGSGQHIGRGSYGGLVVLSSLQNNTTALTDQDVQDELLYQLQNNTLPPPEFDLWGNVNTLYMIDFPPGISISLGPNYNSCSSFGAYHSTFQYKAKSVPYGVHPNCGYGFDTSTEIHSHELVEAITDTEVGLGINPNTGRPAAWVQDSTGQESGDLCNYVGASVSGYVVQKAWSNYAKACVATIPICDGSLSPPACRPCNKYDSGVACGGATPACATSGASAGRCVLCTSNFSNKCTGATPVCDDSKNWCVGCLANADCNGATPVCEASTKTCRGCTIDSECATGSFCDTASDSSKGSCVQCNTDAQCTSGMVCSTSSHACANPPASTPDAGADASAPTAASDSAGGCAVAGGSNGAGVFALLLVLASLVRRKR